MKVLCLVISILTVELYCMSLVHATCPIIHRNRSVLTHFQQLNPCPSTGLTYGSCPGYIKDHIVPLCLTGESGDSIENLQWQTIQDGKVKDKWERKQCRIVGCVHRGD
jgi:hypothetical protein